MMQTAANQSVSNSEGCRGRAATGHALISLAPLFFFLFCCLPGVALAAGPTAAIQTATTKQASDVSIPAEDGYLIERISPQTPTAPTVIHIQEVHASEEAQRHLIKILEQLIETHGLKLILVEGGAGDVSLTHMRQYGHPDVRKDVAEKYLKAGLLGGEEYVDLVSDARITLWGVEDPALYQQNVDAFLAAQPLQESLQPTIAAVKASLSRLRPSVLPKPLDELLASEEAFERERIGLTAYIQRLAEPAKQHGLWDGRYPELDRMLQMQKEERELDLKAVEQEQQELTASLASSLPALDFEALKHTGQALADGKIQPETFYLALKSAAAQAGVTLKSYPKLAAYIHYMAQRAELRPTLVGEELERAANALHEALATTPESRQFLDIRDQASLLERLVDLTLSSSEYQRLAQLPATGLSARWRDFLTTQLTRQGPATQAVPDLSQLESAIPTFRRFYEIAQQRDEALVKNTLAKLHETREPLVVLITGGFHATTIARQLKAQGLGLITVALKSERPVDERLYHAALRYKSGHGNLDDVLAIANQTRTADASR